MSHQFSRRHIARFASMAVPAPTIHLSAGTQQDNGESSHVSDLFPTQPPELVREVVTVAHFNLNRVQELVRARPSLARATWDWGFGDWENALGAASHMGNRPIAEFLIGNGAVPSIFSAAMMGQLELLKALVASQPGIQKLPGPHSISLLAHAKAGGQAALPAYQFLLSQGSADAPHAIPLSDHDQASILGLYTFGSAPGDEILVSVENGHLTWTRKATMGRSLFHLGDRVFHPAGAPAVRIRFHEENDAMLMTVDDPDIVLTARRNSGTLTHG